MMQSCLPNIGYEVVCMRVCSYVCAKCFGKFTERTNKVVTNVPVCRKLIIDNLCAKHSAMNSTAAQVPGVTKTSVSYSEQD